MSAGPGLGGQRSAGDGWDGTDLDERAMTALLAEVSSALASEPEPDLALSLLLDRILPVMADWGVVRVREADGRARRVAVAHRDPALAPLVAELLATDPFSPPPPAVVDELFADRRARVFDPVEDSLLQAVSPDPSTWTIWRRLGLHACAVLPLVTFGQPMGSVVLCLSTPGRTFDPAHLAVAEGLALHCALLVENTRLVRRGEASARVSAARLDVSLAAGGLASWDWDFVHGRVSWSDGAAAALPLPAEAFDESPRSFFAHVDEARRETEREAMVAAAEAAGEYHSELRVRGADGGMRWIEVRGRTVPDSKGRPRRMVGVAADITDRRQAEDIKERLLAREHDARVDAEAAHERLSLLVEAGTVLQGTLDPNEPLEYIPDLVVPRIADWCVVDAVDDTGALVQVGLKHRDPARAADVAATRAIRRDAGGDGIWSVRRAVRTGASELVIDIADDDLVAAARDDEHLALLRSLAPRSAIVAPLIARGRVLGGLTLVATHDRRFAPDDMTLVENLAGRAAMAIDNARLFESRSRVARALQQTLLPPTLPNPGYVTMAARYRVAAGGIDIGGDFYDVYDLIDGSLAVVVGDVCGRGPEAAAITGLFRHTLRAVSIREVEPAEILRQTNAAILGQIEETRFCTAALMRVRRAQGGGARVTVACAGHPRPVVVRASGQVDKVEVAGPLLGVLPRPELAQVEIDLGRGDAIVLYTDGVTEARLGTELFGDARLAAALEGAAGHGAEALADALLAAVDDFRGGESADDIAILAVAAT